MSSNMFVQSLLVLSWIVGWAATQSIDPTTIPLATRGELDTIS
jgi:hypothetical protein